MGDMGLILLILAFLAECVATVLGFHWFGTDGTDWPGFAALGLAFYFAALLFDASWPKIRRAP